MPPQKPISSPVGARFRALRESNGLSQTELSDRLEFKDRQTLSAIENGDRQVKVEELLRAVEIFNVPLETFTDPFCLIGEGAFSWRQSGVSAERLDPYQEDAGRLIAAFRSLAQEVGKEAPLFRLSLPLTKRSSLEEAAAYGERVVDELELGDIPAWNLALRMNDRLGIHVLMVDAVSGVSGAALRLPQFDMVLINRNEVVGRRHFDLAHELFHVLTWDEMPPEHIEDIYPAKRSRVEMLADSFAGAVLMPESVLMRFGSFAELDGDALIAAINRAADELHVTASALRWRLAATGRITQQTAREIPGDALRYNGKPAAEELALPPLFSHALAEVFATAIDEGRLSVRRAASLSGLSVEDLGAMFRSHGIKQPFDL